MTLLRFACLAALGLSASAAPFVFRADAVTRHNTNLRAGPSLSAKVLLVIPRGQEVKLGKCGEWCQVTYLDAGGQHAGYLYAALLKRQLVPIVTPAHPRQP